MEEFFNLAEEKQFDVKVVHERLSFFGGFKSQRESAVKRLSQSSKVGVGK